MAIQVETKDTTALSDSELQEMADICTENENGFDMGEVSKEKDQWVLVSLVRDGVKLAGFSLFNMERIGGTPAFLIGAMAVRRNGKADNAVKMLMTGGYRKAILAFPDEDVLVGGRLNSSDGFEIFNQLEDIVPRQSHKPTGEERQWMRRLGKRYGVEDRLDDKTFLVKGSGSLLPGLDMSVSGSEGLNTKYGEFFKGAKAKKCDQLIAFGWAMAEYLETFQDSARD